MAFADKHGFGRQRTAGARNIEVNLQQNGRRAARVAIFTASAIGYVDNPEALYARGIALGFQERGFHVRMLEERRNPDLRRSLEQVGGAVSRHAFDAFPDILIHSFEPRRGAPLMEWLARELSLVDLAIVVDGAPGELVRWIANLDHPKLSRVFLTYRPGTLTEDRVSKLEIERYDAVFATSRPTADIEWKLIGASIALQDYRNVPAAHLPVLRPDQMMSPADAARTLESVMPSRLWQ